jgi:hypothetical protein
MLVRLLAPSASLLIAACLGLACSKDHAPPGAQRRRTPVVKPPPALLALVELPRGADLSELGAAANEIKPGAGFLVNAALSSQIQPLLRAAVAEGTLSEQDPIRLFIVANTPNEPELVVAAKPSRGPVKAADGGDVVEVGGSVVAGNKAAVQQVASYAAALAAKAPPRRARAVVYVGHVIKVYEAPVRAAGGGIAALAPQGADSTIPKLMSTYVDGLITWAKQTETLEVSVGRRTGEARLQLVFTARPRSAFAEFCAAQRPHTFGMTRKLPHRDNPTVVAEARLRFTEALTTLAAEMFAAMLKQPTGKHLAQTKGLFRLLTGEFATVMVMTAGPSLPVMNNASIMGTRDAPAARRIMEEMLSVMASSPVDFAGIKHHMSFTPAAFEYQGVAVSEMTSKIQLAGPVPSGPQHQRTQWSALDGLLVTAQTSDRSQMPIRAAIDTIRGKAAGLTLSATAQRAMTRARQTKASAAMFVDTRSLLRASAGADTANKVPITGLNMSLAFSRQTMTLELSGYR